MPLTEAGGFQSRIAVNLTGSIAICPCPMIMPRNSILGVSKRHLESFKERPCSRSQRSTHQVRSWWRVKSP